MSENGKVVFDNTERKAKLETKHGFKFSFECPFFVCLSLQILNSWKNIKSSKIAVMSKIDVCSFMIHAVNFERRSKIPGPSHG